MDRPRGHDRDLKPKWAQAEEVLGSPCDLSGGRSSEGAGGRRRCSRLRATGGDPSEPPEPSPAVLALVSRALVRQRRRLTSGHAFPQPTVQGQGCEGPVAAAEMGDAVSQQPRG